MKGHSPKRDTTSQEVVTRNRKASSYLKNICYPHSSVTPFHYTNFNFIDKGLPTDLL